MVDIDELDRFTEHLYMFGLQNIDSTTKNRLLAFYKAGMADMLDAVFDKLGEIGADEEIYNAIESLSE